MMKEEIEESKIETKATVFVVEDNEDLNHMIQKILQGARR